MNIEDTSTAETLFAEDKELRTGWQIESPMLVLEEGRREVEIRFVLDKAETGSGTKPGFTVEYATVEGWTDAGARCELSDNGLMFRFIIERDGTAPTPCTQDLHGIAVSRPPYPDHQQGLPDVGRRTDLPRGADNCRSKRYPGLHFPQ